MDLKRRLHSEFTLRTAVGRVLGSGINQMSEQGNRRTFRVIYSGRVQGVGFRATTQNIAQRFPVVGYVRNQPDGTVELVARGSSAEVGEFLAAVQQRLARQIQNASQELIAMDEDFETFAIR
ncbi:MAG: acylphosphatase [Schlesneria sp.]|nr:acylphosphatase [Schlesneria sp.]